MAIFLFVTIIQIIFLCLGNYLITLWCFLVIDNTMLCTTIFMATGINCFPHHSVWNFCLFCKLTNLLWLLLCIQQLADLKFRELLDHSEILLRKRWLYVILDDFVTKQLPHNVTWGLSLLYAIEHKEDGALTSLQGLTILKNQAALNVFLFERWVL